MSRSFALNDDVLRVFGLAGERMVQTLRIDLVPGDVPKVTIVKLITPGELDQLQTLVEVHRLRPVFESSEATTPVK
jgi:hypothetical protein